jgi:ketosteroid isomerase-like protein
MESSHIVLVKALYEAMGRRDVPAVLKLADPQIELFQPGDLPWAGSYSGHKGLMEFAMKLTQSLDSRFEPDEYVEAGDRLVCLGYTRGSVRSNQNTFEVRAVHIWTIRVGKTIRFEAYIDVPAMRKALGIESAAIQ